MTENAHWIGIERAKEGPATIRLGDRLARPAKPTLARLDEAFHSPDVPVIDVPIEGIHVQTQLNQLPIHLNERALAAGGADYFPVADMAIIHPEDNSLAGWLGIHHNDNLGFVGILFGPDGNVLFSNNDEEATYYALAVLSGIEAANKAMSNGVLTGILQARRAEVHDAFGTMLQALKESLIPAKDMLQMLERGQLTDQIVDEVHTQISRYRKGDGWFPEKAEIEQTHSRHSESRPFPDGMEIETDFSMPFEQPGAHYSKGGSILIPQNPGTVVWKGEDDTHGGMKGQGTMISFHENYDVQPTKFTITAKTKIRRNSR